MEKIIMNFNLIILVIIIMVKGCHLEEDYKKIEYETELNIKITEYDVNRGTAFLNATYAINSASRLISEKPFWLEEKNPPELDFRKNGFIPTINDIIVPYTFFKEKNSNYFFVVKKSDTLKFVMTPY
ncbi:hypothetical protein ACJD0Z_17475 [Flavobacteriaceae bacterium M23B6Z8]